MSTDVLGDFSTLLQNLLKNIDQQKSSGEKDMSK